MDVSKFNIIIKNINKLYNQVDINRDNLLNLLNIINNISLSSINIDEIKKYIEDSKNLQSKIDQILHNELYHIIGMGNLSSNQLATFCKHIKRLGAAEDTNKRNLTCFENIKIIFNTLTSSSQYKLKESISMTLKVTNS